MKNKGLISKYTYLLVFAFAALVVSQTTAFGTEASRNKKINNECEAKAMNYSDGDGQTTPHCQQAMKNKCLADELGKFYPDAESTWTSRVSASCGILSKMNANCPACMK